MTIVDSSVWIDFLNGVTNPETQWLDLRLDHDRIGLTTLILAEVLQGLRDDREAAAVETEPVPSAVDAADDPSVWINPTDPAQSTIIGTDKTAQGGLVSVPFTAVLALTAVAVFSYNGYANAVNFSEDIRVRHETVVEDQLRVVGEPFAHLVFGVPGREAGRAAFD